MKIFVTAKPKSRRPSVKEIDATHLVVAVAAAPEGGKANQAITKALAQHFQCHFADIVLVAGATSRQKVFDIDI